MKIMVWVIMYVYIYMENITHIFIFWNLLVSDIIYQLKLYTRLGVRWKNYIVP